VVSARGSAVAAGSEGALPKGRPSGPVLETKTTRGMGDRAKLTSAVLFTRTRLVQCGPRQQTIHPPPEATTPRPLRASSAQHSCQDGTLDQSWGPKRRGDWRTARNSQAWRYSPAQDWSSVVLVNRRFIRRERRQRPGRLVPPAPSPHSRSTASNYGDRLQRMVTQPCCMRPLRFPGRHTSSRPTEDSTQPDPGSVAASLPAPRIL
jgi:hypothetical protein